MKKGSLYSTEQMKIYKKKDRNENKARANAASNNNKKSIENNNNNNTILYQRDIPLQGQYEHRMRLSPRGPIVCRSLWNGPINGQLECRELAFVWERVCTELRE